ncbi:winged helix-turn-helix domain-containing protein [Natronohydrobacter thiooxidans]|uniref:winged helix-turn-helix domain-containing protein n=1 Tax=Natronohydrobacter thiooxidans TaxID=87172 RepID=UPI0008FF7940|nr:response regulator [Natronohydrobacter thiooxidans]
MSTERAHIVLIEDEPVTREALASYLEGFGHRVSAFSESGPAEKCMEENGADLLIVDINLAGKDGLEITREQRVKSEIGIILLTGRTDDIDRIVGLELGADDYVCKPFNRRELAARVKNLLRRTSARHVSPRKIIKFKGFSLDVFSRQLIDPAGQPLALTRAEFELLRLLANSPGQVMHRERLATSLPHRHDDISLRTVDVLIRRLRMKLDDDPRAPAIIGTSHGEGYFFIPHPN